MRVLFTAGMFIFLAFFNSMNIFAATYYWVGGNGNWSDINHWSITSGGTALHNQAPTAEDDVVFDANSFTAPGQVVTIDAENAFCRSMSWLGATGTPILTGPAGNILNIHGSLTFIPEMAFTFSGDVNFLGSSPALTVDPAGHSFQQNVAFAGAGGEWLLAAPLMVDSIISFNDGRLNTGDQAVDCGYLYVNVRNSGALNLGNSTLRLSGNAFSSGGQSFPVLWVNADNFRLEAGASTIECSAPDIDVLIEGTGVLPFNDIAFTNPLGRTRLLSVPEVALSFQEYRLANHGEFIGPAAFASLFLAEGKSYLLESGSTYTIGTLTANGQCTAPILLRASTAGTATNLQSTGAAVQVEFVSLKDIHASGATFTAGNSSNLGNNVGWLITARSEMDLYWVGGSGNWDDPAHWSFSSGGAGGACIPTGADNVHFDANSFPLAGGQVSINVENAYCRDLDWTGAGGTPVLAGPAGNNLRIYGNLTFIPAMDLQFEGDVYFETEGLINNVTTGNLLFRKDVIFNGRNGTWTLLDSLNVHDKVVFINGTLNTNNQGVTCGRLLSDYENRRRLTLGRSTVTIRDPEGAFSEWLINTRNFTLSARNALIEFETPGVIRHTGSSNDIFEYNVVVFKEAGYLDIAEGVDCRINDLSFLNDGTILNPVIIIQLQLTKGNEYRLVPEKPIVLRGLAAQGDCDAPISVRSLIDDRPAQLQSSVPIRGDYLILKDVQALGPATFNADNTVDLGNNQGWIIDARTSRTLYWVNGTGNWQDPAHWSLSSGGPGGECVPTPIDDVFFDQNSFYNTGQQVTGLTFTNHFCRDMSWDNVSGNPTIDMLALQVFGSLSLSPAMESDIDKLYLRGQANGNTLRLQGQLLRELVIEGTGSWILQDELNATKVEFLNGVFNTNAKNVNIERFDAFLTATPKRLELDGSRIRVSGDGSLSPSWNVAMADLTVEAGISVIDLTHPSARFRNEVPGRTEVYYHVVFSGNTGSGVLESAVSPTRFHLVRFDGDGIMLGANELDSLVFTPGKSYQLEAGQTQTINEYWEIFGNNCTPIELSSTRAGSPSFVTKASGTVAGDFIQMRDQRALGGATFYAGRHSTNIGSSNQGWIFEASDDTPLNVGFLGEDKVLCQNSLIILDADNKSPNETYRWQDGSTASTFPASDPGTYWVKVAFGNECSLTDTVEVLAATNFSVDLGPDTTLCEGERLLLDATVAAAGLRYEWQDNSPDPEFLVTAPGRYSVVLTLGECIETDTINVAFTELPDLDLGPDRTLCAGDILTLDLSNANAERYSWQDGSTAPTLTVSNGGTYWVDAANGRCIVRDSVVISYLSAQSVDLGADTTLCAGETLLLDASLPGATYRWQDGSTLSTLMVNSIGSYSVEVTAEGGCQYRDTIAVDLLELPEINLGSDLALCQGESTMLDGTAGNGADTYLWNTGAVVPTLEVSSAGIYWLEAVRNGCARRDSIMVTSKPLPTVDLGEDQESCQGERLVFDLTGSGDTYLWSTGANSSAVEITATTLLWAEVELSGCRNRDTVQLTFNEQPLIDLGPDQMPCEGETLSIDGTSANGADTYLWNTGATSPLLEIDQPGTYTLTASRNGCERQESIVISYQSPPNIDLGADQTLCEGETILLDVTTEEASYRWSTGDTTPTLEVGTSSTVWVEVDLNGCRRSDTITVTFNPLPRIDLGPDLRLCAGETATIDGRSTNGADSYLWNTGATTPAIEVNNPGNYTLTATLAGCQDQKSVMVEYILLPEQSLGPDRTLCEDTPLTFDLTIPDGRYLWQDGSTSPVYTVAQTGLYWVEIAVEQCRIRDSVRIDFDPLPDFDLGDDALLCEGQILDLTIPIVAADTYLWSDGSNEEVLTVGFPGGLIWGEVQRGACSFRDSVRVDFREQPQVDLGPDTTVCSDQGITLDAGIMADTYLWQDGSNQRTLIVTDAGRYTVEVADGPCVVSDAIEVQFRECTYFNAYLPNAFSPNGDGVNDEFKPLFPGGIAISRYQMAVFDRWGNQIFQTTDPGQGWDGTANGQELPEGVYIYFVEVAYTDDEGSDSAFQRGDVALLR